MNRSSEKWDRVIGILQSIHGNLQQLTEALHINLSKGNGSEFVNVPFKGPEIYLLHKAFVDSGGAPSETYKSFIEKTAAHICNKTQKGFSVESLQKNSDKLDYEAKENVKRFLQKMIRNIDSY